jgi:hypothetical protein
MSLCKAVTILIATFLVAWNTQAQSPDVVNTALDTSGLEFEADGNWASQSAVTADGVDALASTSIGNTESAEVYLAVEGPVSGSFWWKVSSEEGFDFLYLLVDGELTAEISGEVDWQKVDVELTAGVHELSWIYEKDDEGSGGQDKAWLDGFQFGGEEPTPNEPLLIAKQPSDLTVQAGGSATFTVVATGGTGAIQYQWFKDEEAIAGATGATYTIVSATKQDEGNYAAVASVSEDEFVVSNPASLSVTEDGGTTDPGTNGNTWTILIYGHGDHNLSYSLVRDMLEMEQCGSGEGFNIVLQADFNASDREFATFAVESGIPQTVHSGITRYLVGSDTDNNPNTFNSQPVGRLPESLNMDQDSTLKDFLNWGFKTYPADRYGVIFWNHGGQWQGFGGDTQDGTTHTDGLSTAVIKKALNDTMSQNTVSKLDFIAFDTCLMGGAEVLVDFVGYCDLFIANAELDYGDGLEYGGELRLLKEDPTMDIMEYGRKEVPVWDAHHQTQVDQALKVHATFDLNKFNAFSQNLNQLAKGLRTALSSGNNAPLSLQRQTVHYNIGSLEEINKPTDYIDLGEFADRIANHSSFNASIKTSAQAVSRSIDDMVLGMSAGTKRTGRVHGLSIYFPTKGVTENNTYLDLAFNALPDAAWQGFMGDVARAYGADTGGPGVSVGNSGSARRNGGNDRGAGDVVFVGSLDDPASLVFNLKEGNDAYGFYAALVSNLETEDPNEHVYLGEIATGLADGPGEYELYWDTTAVTISSSPDDGQPYLGGWYQESGSNIMISYADYVAPGETEPVEVILITELGEESGQIIQVLDSAQDTLSAAADVQLAPGGKLIPVYYTENRVGDPETWDVYDVFFEDNFVLIPEDGLAGIKVEYLPVFLGDYTVEIAVTDIFDNQSDILTFPVLVLDDITKLPKTPTLAVTQSIPGELKISWPQVDGGLFTLEATSDLGGEWTPVDNASIGFDETNGLEFFTASTTDQQQFYRLSRKVAEQ